VRDSTKLMQGMVSFARRACPSHSHQHSTSCANSAFGLFVAQNDTFDETGGFLGGTMKKMNRMAKRQGGQFCLCEWRARTRLAPAPSGKSCDRLWADSRFEFFRDRFPVDLFYCLLLDVGLAAIGRPPFSRPSHDG